jgi:hypothetical protein
MSVSPSRSVRTASNEPASAESVGDLTAALWQQTWIPNDLRAVLLP